MKSWHFWPLIRALFIPLLMMSLAYLLLRDPLASWLQGEDQYDQDALTEWVRESRIHQTLPEFVDNFLKSKDRYIDLEAKFRSPDPGPIRPTNDEVQAAKHLVDSNREQIEE